VVRVSAVAARLGALIGIVIVVGMRTIDRFIATSRDDRDETED